MPADVENRATPTSSGEKRPLLFSSRDVEEFSEDDDDILSLADVDISRSRHVIWLCIYPLLVCLGLLVHVFIFRGFSINFDSRARTEDSQAIDTTHRLVRYQATTAAATPIPLVDFQVYPPVLTPTNQGLAFSDGSADVSSAAVAGQAAGCVRTQVIMSHVFANSYNNPFVGPYTPPANCKFNRITLNLTVTSAGRQFDRLGIVYFGSTEIWRTSTAEPTATGIVWTYIKDMSEYLSLFQNKQKLIFDLGNLINNIYTGSYNATLTATFFNSQDTVDPADLIIPVSQRLGSKNMPSAWQYTSQDLSNTFSVPRNTRKAVFTIAATGQIAEEFWFGNALQSEVNTFGPGVLYGYSPFREVQLEIDGNLAGVVWPFPIIFTGGVVPGLWRPIVGIDAFDLREDEIDITPFLPMLCDGKSHTYVLRVVGIADDGHNNGHLNQTVGSYWVITGKVFIWLDPAGSMTTGSGFAHNVPNPNIQLSSQIGKLANGTNHTLTYTVDVTRQLSISSTIKTANGSQKAQWTQNLAYANLGNFTKFGNIQVTTQSTNGTDISTTGYSRTISYPIFVNDTYHVNKNGSFTIDGAVNRGQYINIAGMPIFPTGLQSFSALPRGKNVQNYQGSELSTTQNGTAHYFSNANNSYATSSGTTMQDMDFRGFQERDGSGSSSSSSQELYTRHVVAVNGAVTEDRETLIGEPTNDYSRPAQPASVDGQFAGGSIRKALGRGPGSSQA